VRISAWPGRRDGPATTWDHGLVTFGNVLFDLDGTLTDSAEGITGSMRFALAALGLPPVDAATLRSFVGPPLADSLREVCRLDDAHIEQVMAAYRERYVSTGMFENAVYPGIVDLLQALRDDGRRMAVATSKLANSAVAICDNFGLSGFFEAICGADLAGLHESKTQIVADALAALGRPADAVLIGDRLYDVVGARDNHVAVIGAGWGYGEPGELVAAGATSIAADAAALAGLLGVSARYDELSRRSRSSARSGDDARA
jgi:phosphoglycolate phosphatase